MTTKNLNEKQRELIARLNAHAKSETRVKITLKISETGARSYSLTKGAQTRLKMFGVETPIKYVSERGNYDLFNDITELVKLFGETFYIDMKND